MNRHRRRDGPLHGPRAPRPRPDQHLGHFSRLRKHDHQLPKDQHSQNFKTFSTHLWKGQFFLHFVSWYFGNLSFLI